VKATVEEVGLIRDAVGIGGGESSLLKADSRLLVVRAVETNPPAVGAGGGGNSGGGWSWASNPGRMSAVQSDVVGKGGKASSLIPDIEISQDALRGGGVGPELRNRRGGCSGPPSLDVTVSSEVWL
jgi:hypothetical protein